MAGSSSRTSKVCSDATTRQRGVKILSSILQAPDMCPRPARGGILKRLTSLQMNSVCSIVCEINGPAACVGALKFRGAPKGEWARHHAGLHACPRLYRYTRLRDRSRPSEAAVLGQPTRRRPRPRGRSSGTQKPLLEAGALGLLLLHRLASTFDTQIICQAGSCRVGSDHQRSTVFLAHRATQAVLRVFYRHVVSSGNVPRALRASGQG